MVYFVAERGGIRTPGTLARTPHFECGAIDHSATSPRRWRAPMRGFGSSARRYHALRSKRKPLSGFRSYGTIAMKAGFSEARVAKARSEGEPYAGFWPAATGYQRRHGGDALDRWFGARRDGLSAAKAAQAVGVARWTLFRWRQRCEFKSRRPHKLCGPRRPAGLAQQVDRLRLDFPMWVKAKIGPLVCELGFQASDSTGGTDVDAKLAAFRYALDRNKLRQARRREGRYLPRSNLTEGDPATLWNYYLQLGQVEEAFKNLKGDLAIRAIFHQDEERIEAHIFIAFLAYCLHVTIGLRLKGLAPGLTPRSLFEKFAAVQMIDVRIPTTDGRELQLTRYTARARADAASRTPQARPAGPAAAQNRRSRSRSRPLRVVPTSRGRLERSQKLSLTNPAQSANFG